MQSLGIAVLYGGCQICDTDSNSDDPSGSDSTDAVWFSIDGLTRNPPEVEWSSRQTHGHVQQPPRKGHDIEPVGCDKGHNQHGSCVLYVFGGWNPRWPSGYTGHAAMQKLDISTWTWSQVPAGTELVRGDVRPSPSCPVILIRSAEEFCEGCFSVQVVQDSADQRWQVTLTAISTHKMLLSASYLSLPLVVPVAPRTIIDTRSFHRALRTAYAGAPRPLSLTCTTMDDAVLHTDDAVLGTGLDLVGHVQVTPSQ
jgi:hypothetical protein